MDTGHQRDGQLVASTYLRCSSRSMTSAYLRLAASALSSTLASRDASFDSLSLLGSTKARQSVWEAWCLNSPDSSYLTSEDFLSSFCCRLERRFHFFSTSSSLVGYSVGVRDSMRRTSVSLVMPTPLLHYMSRCLRRSLVQAGPCRARAWHTVCNFWIKARINTDIEAMVVLLENLGMEQGESLGLSLGLLFSSSFCIAASVVSPVTTLRPDPSPGSMLSPLLTLFCRRKVADASWKAAIQSERTQ